MKKQITKTQKLGLVYIILMFICSYIGIKINSSGLLFISLFFAIMVGYKLCENDIERKK